MTQNFSRYGICASTRLIVFNPKSRKKKVMTKFLEQLKKNLFLTVLGPFWEKTNFLRNWAMSGLRFYNYLPSCKKSEDTNVWLPRKTPNWQTDRRSDRHANSHFVGSSVYGVPAIHNIVLINLTHTSHWIILLCALL